MEANNHDWRLELYNYLAKELHARATEAQLQDMKLIIVKGLPADTEKVTLAHKAIETLNGQKDYSNARKALNHGQVTKDKVNELLKKSLANEKELRTRALNVIDPLNNVEQANLF